MNYVLVFRPEVREEVNEAYDWYETQKLGLGDEFLDGVEQTLNQISSRPELYQTVYRDLRRVGLRYSPPNLHCFLLDLKPTQYWVTLLSTQPTLNIFHFDDINQYFLMIHLLT